MDQHNVYFAEKIFWRLTTDEANFIEHAGIEEANKEKIRLNLQNEFSLCNDKGGNGNYSAQAVENHPLFTKKAEILSIFFNTFMLATFQGDKTKLSYNAC